MPTITSNQTSGPGIGLPNGAFLGPGESVAYDDDLWKKHSKRRVIQHYLDTEQISVGKGKPEPTAEELEQQALLRQEAEAQALLAKGNADEAQKQADEAEQAAKDAEKQAKDAAAAVPKAPATTRRN